MITIAFIIIFCFALGFFAGSVWYSIGKHKKEVEPFDESDIYNPKLKTFRNEKHIGS